MFFLLLFTLLLPEAQAAPKCIPRWNEEGTFFGGNCDSMGIRNSVGRAVVSMGEIMRVNPAVLPVLPTPYGAEFNMHDRGYGPQDSHSEFHLIKGFSGIGLAFSSWNTGSMVGSDLPAIFIGSPYESHYRIYESTPASSRGYRLGGAFRVPVISRGMVRLRAGFTLGSGKVNREGSSGFGTVLDIGVLYLSYSKMMDKYGSSLQGVDTHTFAVGLDSGRFHLGYASAQVYLGRRLPSSQFFTLRYTGELWTTFASLKTYSSYSGERLYWPSVTIHRYVSDSLSLGYLYGLYRNSHSLSLQLYM